MLIRWGKIFQAAFVSVICVNVALAQVSPAVQSNYNLPTQILPPAPDAAALGKYGGINLGLSSGTPNINIPLYQYSSSNISIPISLSYTTSGLKVDEIASRVGMGWALNAGGVITRTVRGSVDELSSRLTPPYIDDRTFYNYLVQVGGDQGPFGTFDTQPDVYNFNFNGNTGSFITNDSTLPDGTKASQPILLTYSNIVFDRSIHSATAGYDFRAITADGVQYWFSAGDFSSTFNAASVSTDQCNYIYNQNIPTAWYLQKIIHPNNDTIIFSYTPIQFNYLASASQAIYQVNPYTTSQGCPLNYLVQAPTLNNTLCVNELQTTGQYLSQISSTAGGKVTFSYIDRSDYNDKLLSSIAIYQPDSLQPCKIFNLNYTYPGANSAYLGATYDPSLSSRPYLMSVVESSPDNSLSKKHSFLYNDFGSVPPRLSFAQDYWGYFNGQQNSTFIPVPIDPIYQSYLPLAMANRDPNPTYSQKGILSSITYPTGGKDSILYEGNLATQLVTTNPPPVTMSLTGSSDNIDVTYTSPTITISFSQNVQLYGYRSQTDVDDSALNYTNIRILDANGNTMFFKSLSVPGVYTDNENIYLQGGTYTIIMDVAGNNPSAGCQLTYLQGTQTQQLLNVPVGGVRVSQVLTYDNVTQTTSIKKYAYGPGTTGSQPVYEKYLNLTQTCASVVPELPLCSGLVNFEYYTMVSNSIYNIYATAGSPVSYGDVTETFGANAENGGIEHQFTVETDAPAGILIGDPIPGSPSVSQAYLNGRETSQRVFKTQGSTQVPVKEVFTHYKSDIGVPLAQLAYVIKQKYVFDCNETGPVLLAEWGGYDCSVYEFQTNWLYPDTVRTLTFDANGTHYVEQDQYFTYADKTSALPTTITANTSNGESSIVNNYYPTSIVLAGTPETARQGLVNQHIVSPILQQQSSKGTSQTYLTTTDYGIFSNGLILPQMHSSSVENNPLEKRVEFYRYSSNGKVVEQGKENDMLETYLWDYGNLYPVARVVGADSLSVAYTSFETSNTGNWAVTGGNMNTNGGITGNGSYTFTNGASITKSGLPFSNNYVLTYWSLNGALNIAGTTAITGSTRNGWTFYRHLLPAGSTSVTLNGAGITIDELRLYPINAQMTTYTYAPLVGMISQCDVGNRVTYYEYDGLQRLKRVRDQDRDILKQYDYQYQMLVPYTFNNDIQIGPFTCSCGTGGIGSTVNDTVQANTFSSSISKADANARAIAYLNANGQANANTKGICTYFNTPQYGPYTKNNCSCLYTGSTVTYTVPANTYSSTVNVGAANQLALNDVNANGQNYANANGTCSTTCTGPTQELTNCTCQTGTYEVVHQYTTGKNTTLACVTQWGYMFPDGTYTVTKTETDGGNCP